MELARIMISEINDQQVVFLKEAEGERTLPILIGFFEATSIDRRVRQEVPPRPPTHELLKNAIELLGGEVQDILVTSLVDQVYYAEIRIMKDGELIALDSRPSDAIALAVHHDPILPIYVHEDVLDEVTS
jgi:bifunctional DNase/RNase